MRTKDSSPAVDRRSQIISAARELYERQGIDKTSVKDITERVGVTRSLFYHYFSSKEDVIDAILEGYVTSFTRAVRKWDESRTFGDVTGAVKSCADTLRQNLFDTDSFRVDLLRPQNALLYQQFVQRVAEALATYITETTAVEYARYHRIEITHVYESFYLLIVGLIGYMRRNPDTPDEVVEDLIIDTLHLDVDGSMAIPQAD